MNKNGKLIIGIFKYVFHNTNIELLTKKTKNLLLKFYPNASKVLQVAAQDFATDLQCLLFASQDFFELLWKENLNRR